MSGVPSSLYSGRGPRWSVLKRQATSSLLKFDALIGLTASTSCPSGRQCMRPFAVPCGRLPCILSPHAGGRAGQHSNQRVPIHASPPEHATSKFQIERPGYFTDTLTSALVQQHRKPPPPLPVQSFATRYRVYSPGSLKVAVVFALPANAAAESPVFFDPGFAGSKVTEPGPRYLLQVSVTAELFGLPHAGNQFGVVGCRHGQAEWV